MSRDFDKNCQKNAEKGRQFRNLCKISFVHFIFSILSLTGTPQFAFGHGLSYAATTLTAALDGASRIAVTVQNDDAKRATDEVEVERFDIESYSDSSAK